MHKPHSGVVLIAKFCINIVFFGCCMHFGHIAASLYAKWLNTDWTSYGSLWLPCHSTLDLLGNSVSSKTVQLMIFSVISAVAPHSFPPHTTSLVNGRAESGQWRNKHISCHNFANLRQYCFHPQVLSLHLIISSALSTNEIHILEKKKPISNWILMKPYLEELVSISDWPEITDLAKLIVIFSSQSTDNMIPEMRFEWANMPNHTVSVYKHLLKDWRL